LLLDSAFRVQRANPAFFDTFHGQSSAVVGRYIYDIGDKEWGVPELRRLLEEVLPEQKDFRGLRIRLPTGAAGPQEFELEAHRIESGRRRQGVILLMFRKVGDHESASADGGGGTTAQRERAPDGISASGGGDAGPLDGAV